MDNGGKITSAFIGGFTGLATWLHNIGIDEAFTGQIIKTIIIATISTVTGLIVRSIYLKIGKIIDKYYKIK